MTAAVPATRWQQTLVATLAATPGALDDPAARDGPMAWTAIGRNASVSVWSLAIGASRFFVKAAAPAQADMLSAEVEALAALREAHAVRVPQVYANARPRTRRSSRSSGSTSPTAAATRRSAGHLRRCTRPRGRASAGIATTTSA